MLDQIRRFRRSSATTEPPPRRHARPAEVPQPPHAAPVPAPADLYAAEHQYLPSTIDGLRTHAKRCLGKAADARIEIDELYDKIARWEAEAADHFRIAALVEFENMPSPQSAAPVPAMGADELVNGWQSGFERAVEPSERNADRGEAVTEILPVVGGAL